SEYCPIQRSSWPVTSIRRWMLSSQMLSAMSPCSTASGFIRPPQAYQAAFASVARLAPEFFLDFENAFGGCKHRIGVEAHRFDACLNEKFRHFRPIRRRLAAEAGVDVVALAAFDGHTDHGLDALVALIERGRDDFRVPIHAQRELGQAVRADRETVEPLGDFVH